MSVVPLSDQVITCALTGISEYMPVTWIGPDNNEISSSDTDNYLIEEGAFIFEEFSSYLTIKVAKFDALPSSSNFKCSVKSTLYPADSPEVVKEMTLTILSFGKTKS